MMLYHAAQAEQKRLMRSKQGGSVSVSEEPTEPVSTACVFTYAPPYARPVPLKEQLSNVNLPKALSASYLPDDDTPIYAAGVANKVVGHAFDLHGAGEEGVLFLPLDNAMWNDEAEPFYHHGRHVYDSVPSAEAVEQGRRIILKLLTSQPAVKELRVVLFMASPMTPFRSLHALPANTVC